MRIHFEEAEGDIGVPKRYIVISEDIKESITSLNQLSDLVEEDFEWKLKAIISGKSVEFLGHADKSCVSAIHNSRIDLALTLNT